MFWNCGSLNQKMDAMNTKVEVKKFFNSERGMNVYYAGNENTPAVCLTTDWKQKFWRTKETFCISYQFPTVKLSLYYWWLEIMVWKFWLCKNCRSRHFWPRCREKLWGEGYSLKVCERISNQTANTCCWQPVNNRDWDQTSAANRQKKKFVAVQHYRQTTS